jgi:hypothetical protein
VSEHLQVEQGSCAVVDRGTPPQCGEQDQYRRRHENDPREDYPRVGIRFGHDVLDD